MSPTPASPSPTSLTDRVKAVYAAFARGDVPTILEIFSEDVDWEYGRATQSEVPWLRSGKGRAHAASFFQALGGLEFQRFEVKEVLEGPDVVVALVDLDFIIKA